MTLVRLSKEDDAELMEQRHLGITHGSRITTWLGVAVLLLGLFSYVQFIVSPRYSVAITDFGRDIAAARAVDHGINPYQRLGDLSDAIPELAVATKVERQWVAHSPLSIAAARAAWMLLGDRAEEVGKFGVILATVLLVSGIASRGLRSTHSIPWFGLSAAVLISIGVEADLHWIQAASLHALLLGVVLWADRSKKHGIALLLLGVVVAWRPWCWPLALFLPESKRPIRDGVAVAAVAGAATLAVLPVVGGLPSLVRWLTLALPENASQYLADDWNLALTGMLWPAGAVVAVATVLYLGLVSSRQGEPSLRPRIGALTTLLLLPLVWSHYWLGLLTFLLPERTSRDAQPLLLGLAYLAMAVTFVGWSAPAARAGAVLALGLLVLAMVIEMPGKGWSPTLPSRLTDRATMQKS